MTVNLKEFASCPEIIPERRGFNERRDVAGTVSMSSGLVNSPEQLSVNSTDETANF